MARIEPFEKYPGRYEDWFERNRFAYESEVLAIKKFLPEDGEGIEIGVGTGRFALPLGIKLGVEPSPRMKEIAEKRMIRVIGGVAENLPLGNEQFDFILMVTTICFLDDIETAFKEACRVLKPEGCLIIGLIDKESPLGKLYQKRKKSHVFYRVATFYSVDEVVYYLEKAGFKSFKFVQTIFRNLEDIKEVEPVIEGYGRGSFVVIKGRKWK